MPARAHSQRVDAVILKHSDWGEADRLLWLFTRQMGKVRAIAKGIRKPRSRKSGHLEPFTLATLQLAWGRDLHIITQAEAIDTHTGLREDLLRLSYASYIVELLDRFTQEEGENRTLFRLLIDTLARLELEEDPAMVVRYYEIRLLDLIGFRPQLVNCSECGKAIKPEDQYFSAAKGGVLCPDCGKRLSGARPISLRALKVLRHFQRSNYAEAKRALLKSETDRELENLMGYYLTYHLERGLNTPVFLRRLRSGKVPQTEDTDTEQVN